MADKEIIKRSLSGKAALVTKLTETHAHLTVENVPKIILIEHWRALPTFVAEKEDKTVKGVGGGSV